MYVKRPRRESTLPTAEAFSPSRRRAGRFLLFMEFIKGLDQDERVDFIKHKFYNLVSFQELFLELQT